MSLQVPPLKVFCLMVASRVKPFFSRTFWAGVFSGWVSAWMRMMSWLRKKVVAVLPDNGYRYMTEEHYVT